MKLASGFLCFGPATFTSAAFILSIFANLRCYLVSVDDDSPLANIYGDNWYRGYNPESLGLWCYEAVNGNAYEYSDRDFGSKFDAARALGLTAIILGGFLWLFYLVTACIPCGPTVFRLIGVLAILTCLFQGLVFLVFRSDVCDGELDGQQLGCGLDTGGKCGIAACVCWFVAGLMSCGSGKTPDDDEN